LFSPNNYHADVHKGKLQQSFFQFSIKSQEKVENLKFFQGTSTRRQHSQQLEGNAPAMFWKAASLMVDPFIKPLIVCSLTLI